MSQFDVFEQIARSAPTSPIQAKRSRVRRMLMTGRCVAEVVRDLGFGRLFNYQFPKRHRKALALRAVVGAGRHDADGLMYLSSDKR